MKTTDCEHKKCGNNLPITHCAMLLRGEIKTEAKPPLSQAKIKWRWHLLLNVPQIEWAEEFLLGNSYNKFRGSTL